MGESSRPGPSSVDPFGSVVIPPIAGGLRVEVTIPAGSGGEFIVPAQGLHYVRAGRVRAFIDETERVVEAGTLLTVPPGPRRMETLAETSVQTVALPEGAFTGRFGAEAAILTLSRRDGREWAERMHALLHSNDEASRLEAASIATELREEAAEARARGRFDLVQRVLDFLSTTLDRAPTLQELSDRFGFAPNHLNEIVSTCTGRSIRQWTIAFRLEGARSALRRRTDSIAAVATQFGFEPAYFTRRFASRYHLSPAAWRAVTASPLSKIDVVEEQVSPYGVRISGATSTAVPSSLPTSPMGRS